MKLFQIINNKDFQNARIIIYLVLFIFYIYLAYFSNFKCMGCPLCGMTRAVKSILMLRINEAVQYNPMSIIFCFIIPLIIIDLITIVISNYAIYLRLRNNKK